jgi:hypothetical protein
LVGCGFSRAARHARVHSALDVVEKAGIAQRTAGLRVSAHCGGHGFLFSFRQPHGPVADRRDMIEGVRQAVLSAISRQQFEINPVIRLREEDILAPISPLCHMVRRIRYHDSRYPEHEFMLSQVAGRIQNMGSVPTFPIRSWLGHVTNESREGS